MPKGRLRKIKSQIVIKQVRNLQSSVQLAMESYLRRGKIKSNRSRCVHHFAFVVTYSTEQTIKKNRTRITPVPTFVYMTED